MDQPLADPPLIKLSSGEWVDPRCVRYIGAMPANASGVQDASVAGPRVLIWLANGALVVVNYPDHDAARAAADAIGMAVNAVRPEASRGYGSTEPRSITLRNTATASLA